MIFNMSGSIGLGVRNIRPDTSVEGSKMQAVELIVGDTATPCVIRKVVWGNLNKMTVEQVSDTSFQIFRVIRRTAHMKKGFVGGLITTKWIQLWVYIHTDHLESFLGACAMSIVRNGLKI